MIRFQSTLKYTFFAFFLMFAVLAVAQKTTDNTSTTNNNTLGGGGTTTGPVQTSTVGVHDNATSNTAHVEKGDDTPVGILHNPNDIFNTGAIGGELTGGNSSSTGSTTTGCPLMYVDVDVPFLQSCVNSTARVSYCNHGNSLATGVYVDVELDNELTLDSSSISYVALGNNIYRFQIGTVLDSACSGFDLHLTTDCDSTLLNQEHCIAAHIYPDTVCSSVWNGYLLDTDGQCMGDSIVFGLQNNGPSITPSQQVRFVIIDDHLLINGSKTIIKQGLLTIGSGQYKELTLANIVAGKNYKLELLDVNNSLLVSTSVSNCSVSNNGTVYNYNPQVLWNGSTLPSVDVGCNINGSAPVVARGTAANNNNNTLQQTENKVSDVLVYPNPMHSYTTIQIEGEVGEEILFRLYDLTGRMVRMKKIIGETRFEIQRENLQSGVYLFRLESLSEMIGAGKLVIE